ncbi:MAG: hypothetical protein RIT43_2323 [Bacteroidota bacterium]
MFCFVLNSYIGFTQGNLQFNQVKLVSTVETVPTGKVWKVESVTFSSGLPYIGSSSAGAGSWLIKINSTDQVVKSYSFQSNGGFAVFDAIFPIWLPSGTTLSAHTGVNHVSVIEFNVVP